MEGWHREWTWISSRRHGAPTCSLGDQGRVKGVFLRLNTEAAGQDLEELRRRERKSTERVVSNVPEPGAETHFWTMGSNLDQHSDLRGLEGDELLRGLAHRAQRIEAPGPDGVSASEYVRRVHEFDPEDELTARLIHFLNSGPQQLRAQVYPPTSALSGEHPHG